MIREELGKILIREMDFGGAFPTITEVVVDKKLEHATVNVSVIPSEKAVRTVTALNVAAPRLQHMLWQKINIKPMPRIAFVVDHGPENAARVEKIALRK